MDDPDSLVSLWSAAAEDAVPSADTDFCIFRRYTVSTVFSNTFLSLVLHQCLPIVKLDLDADRWHLGISVTVLFVFAGSVNARDSEFHQRSRRSPRIGLCVVF